MNILILGLSITSSWGNGHATTYRALVRSLARRGHDVLFLERDVPWYAEHRDLPNPPYGRTELYASVDDLRRRFSREVAQADLVIVGSYVPDGVAVGNWVIATATGLTAFYDIDTPVTLAKLARGDYEYLTPSLIPQYQLYLSFTGGPTLQFIERELGSPLALPLYCSVDVDLYQPGDVPSRWDLNYMGTYSPDRQPTLERLLLQPARRSPQASFAVAGPQYPESIDWPGNVHRIDHLPPAQHAAFYSRTRFTLNVTRSDMVQRGWSPSVRLFEAAACGAAIISDSWPGIETLFEPGREILIAQDTDEVLDYLHNLGEADRQQMAHLARRRVLSEHTSDRRAAQLEQYVAQAAAGTSHTADAAAG